MGVLCEYLMVDFQLNFDNGIHRW